MSNSKDKKSLTITYFLCLIGGYFGLHHFYLHRDRHCFITFITFGSYFGFGLIRDLWRIPEYVKDYNNDKDYLAALTQNMRKLKKPDTGYVRYCGEIIVADILGYLVVGAIPKELLPNEITFQILCAVLVPLACGIGIHTVGNIGRHQGSLFYPLLGGYFTCPLYFFTPNSVFFTSLVSCSFFNKYSKQWRRTYSIRSPLLKRLFILSLCFSLYACFWFSWVYFNCSFLNEDEQEVKCREAIVNFFNSPLWQDFTKVISDLKMYIKVHGFRGIWKEILEALDSKGEANALQVLNLTKEATQEEITTSYRKLAREWHPDRHRDLEKKKLAQEKFIAIQQAYETISRIKSQRSKKNTNFSDEKT